MLSASNPLSLYEQSENLHHIQAEYKCNLIQLPVKLNYSIQ